MKKSSPGLQLLPGLCTGLMILTGFPLMSFAQESEQEPAKAEAAADEAEKSPSILDIPEGLDVDGLMAHYTKIIRSAPENGASGREWLKARIGGVIACCDKALELKPEGKQLVAVY